MRSCEIEEQGIAPLAGPHEYKGAGVFDGQTVALIETSAVDFECPLHRQICHNFDLMLGALKTGDQEAAGKVAHTKKIVKKLAEDATEHLARRLIADEPNRLAAFQVETDIIESLQRLNALTRLVARQLEEIPGSSGEGRRFSETTEETHTPSPDATL